MPDLSLNESPIKVLTSIDINIPQQLHQEPVLAKLIGNYHLVVNFQAAILDRKATGGGWFNLNLEGHPQNIETALTYLQELGVEVFDRGSVPLVFANID
ncbi:NIL domain-containing protein [Chamaesiphon minutus]|uniref:ABC-type metal ion transport system, ATPase component n=1 Tax=Chamaesiphon minutus (strain ATCC 27169 / PCC 6605) TaxID=1173020 RepID=K9UA94_CHAP6|nr:NIL domain-containing protein [Chamaesiphon minutus]AFY91321.1 ABC-type metal ion transport system, ATPase component [Chamaesiphon minutus PCC 6605]